MTHIVLLLAAFGVIIGVYTGHIIREEGMELGPPQDPDRVTEDISENHTQVLESTDLVYRLIEGNM